MYRSPAAAYETGTRAATSPREIEAAALSKAARLLEACQRAWDAPGRSARLSEALRYNQRLWTVFQADLARPDHELPLELRINVLRLSAFVDRRTFEVLGAPRPEKLQALIDINRSLAAGLEERRT